MNKDKNDIKGSSAGILEQCMGARNRVGIGFSHRPARLNRLAESIPGNRFLVSLQIYKFCLKIRNRGGMESKA
jgi:hypothetical protein